MLVIIISNHQDGPESNNIEQQVALHSGFADLNQGNFSEFKSLMQSRF